MQMQTWEDGPESESFRWYCTQSTVRARPAEVPPSHKELRCRNCWGHLPFPPPTPPSPSRFVGTLLTQLLGSGQELKGASGQTLFLGLSQPHYWRSKHFSVKPFHLNLWIWRDECQMQLCARSRSLCQCARYKWKSKTMSFLVSRGSLATT